MRGLHIFTASQGKVASGGAKRTNHGASRPTETHRVFAMIHDGPDRLQRVLTDERRHPILLHHRKPHAHREATV
jgi:hypothetical protein